MTSFSVNDMTCGHCVSSITKAVKAVDPGALVRIDLATQRVDIEPTEADAAELGDAIKMAGYTPIAIDRPTGPAVEAAAPGRKGCCCG
jgi:copper chaperone